MTTSATVRTGLSGLGFRLTAAAAAAALAATALLGLSLAPLIGSSVEAAAREPLARQATLLSEVPAAVSRGRFVGRVAASADLAIGRVSSDGEATGVAVALTPGQVAALLAGRSSSTTGTYDGTTVLIEARPSTDGGGVVVATGADVVSQATTTLRRRVAVATVAALVIAALLGGFLARHLGRPLRQTASAARRLADGERGVPVPDAGTSEVADVARALRALDAALSSSEARQRSFLLSVSHELRTPLTAIRGYAESFEDGLVDSSQQRDVGHALSLETQRLERYIGDLLQLARLEGDEFRLERAELDVSELVTAAAGAWQVRARSQGIVVTSTAPAAVHLVSDSGRIRQVVDALVDNAVRVCAPGDRVEIAAYEDRDAVVVVVSDTGPGLSEDDALVAFQPGVLHERYRSSRPGGHGLGLAIVHRLVTLLGGTVRLSGSLAEGTRFEIRLPRSDV